MNVAKTFLQLTSQTYPHGTENGLKQYLPKNIQTDEFGNYFIKIGESKTMFTCHLDTACKKQEPVKHIFNKNMISTNGSSILGADDKAGMVVLLYMIEHNIPGQYYFFLGEEVGCLGSSYLAKSDEWDRSIQRVISFDRRGTVSVITHQLMGRCCSDEFAEELSRQLNSSGLVNLSPDDTGVLTDSASFMELIPECTNISVGYYHEHTTSECQNIEYLLKLCQSSIHVDWENLPTKRDPKETYDFSKIFQGYVSVDSEDMDGFTFLRASEYFTYIYSRNGTGKIKVGLTEDRILEEVEMIKNFVLTWIGRGHYDAIEWNGQSLWLMNCDNGAYDFMGTRKDLLTHIPELTHLYDDDVIWIEDKPTDMKLYTFDSKQIFSKKQTKQKRSRNNDMYDRESAYQLSKNILS
jgi:hypothetical protein